MHWKHKDGVVVVTAGLLKRTRVQALPLRRILWSLVALAHAPGLIGAWRSFTSGVFAAEDLRGCVLLTLSMLFLALKVCDVRFLRFRTDPRSCIALGLVVALLHVNVIHAGDGPTLIPEYTTLVVTVALAGSSALVRRRLHLARTFATAITRHLPRLLPAAGTVWLDTVRPRCWVLLLRVFRLRAPPA